MKIYIAGPMSGYEDWNRPAFDRAAALLRAEGLEVVSPADLSRACFEEDGGAVRPWDYYMRRALKLLVDCDGVFMLRGWPLSKGARLEQMVALQLGLQIRFEAHWGTREWQPFVLVPEAAGAEAV